MNINSSIFHFVSEEIDSLRELVEFLNEGMIMKDFDHKNVLSLYGVVITEIRPYVILPFMDNGDLKKYISNAQNVSMH